MKPLLTIILLVIASQTMATSYYISPSGTNTDGRSFATAWREFSGIRGLQRITIERIGQ